MPSASLLHASSIKAQVQYRQELSSLRSLRHEESKERARMDVSRGDFWRQARAAADSQRCAAARGSLLSPAERMWRTHTSLQEAVTKHHQLAERMQASGARLAAAQQRLDMLQKMVDAAKRNRVQQRENQLSDEMADVCNRVSQSDIGSRLQYRNGTDETPQTSMLWQNSPVGGLLARGLPEPCSERPFSDDRVADLYLASRHGEVIGVVRKVAVSEKALVVECSLGGKGDLSVSLVKRPGEAIRAVVSPEGTQLALLVQRERATVLRRLNEIGVHVDSLDIGERGIVDGDRGGQRMRRRIRPEDDEPRIA